MPLVERHRFLRPQRRKVQTAVERDQAWPAATLLRHRRQKSTGLHRINDPPTIDDRHRLGNLPLQRRDRIAGQQLPLDRVLNGRVEDLPTTRHNTGRGGRAVELHQQAIQNRAQDLGLTEIAHWPTVRRNPPQRRPNVVRHFGIIALDRVETPPSQRLAQNPVVRLAPRPNEHRNRHGRQSFSVGTPGGRSDVWPLHINERAGELVPTHRASRALHRNGKASIRVERLTSPSGREQIRSKALSQRRRLVWHAPLSTLNPPPNPMGGRSLTLVDLDLPDPNVVRGAH